MDNDDLETNEPMMMDNDDDDDVAVPDSAPRPPKAATSTGATAAATTTATTTLTSTAATASAGSTNKDSSSNAAARNKVKKKKRQSKEPKSSDGEGPPRKKKSKKNKAATAVDPQAAAQQAVNEQMRRVLEEDRYSAAGSIVEEPDSDAEDYLYRGQPVRLDRAALQQAMKKYMAREQRLFRLEEESSNAPAPADISVASAANSTRSKKKNKKKEQEKGWSSSTGPSANTAPSPRRADQDPLLDDDVDLDRDGGSIFGQTTGSSNATWVECDKCKKWRRLRGVVDEKKLPKQWFCSMNKSDPERSRCSAPEEEYNDTVQAQSPESLADMRARKHLRVWVRRLQCNEAYEARQPTQTRGKKRATTSSAKDPYEWVRCCNPACGKWRAILRFMDAKGNVMDRAKDGEWYCVMNTWDEKMASCAAPQENLPAIGCPPWVMQDE